MPLANALPSTGICEEVEAFSVSVRFLANANPRPRVPGPGPVHFRQPLFCGTGPAQLANLLTSLVVCAQVLYLQRRHGPQQDAGAIANHRSRAACSTTRRLTPEPLCGRNKACAAGPQLRFSGKRKLQGNHTPSAKQRAKLLAADRKFAVLAPHRRHRWQRQCAWKRLVKRRVGQSQAVWTEYALRLCQGA